MTIVYLHPFNHQLQIYLEPDLAKKTGGGGLKEILEVLSIMKIYRKGLTTSRGKGISKFTVYQKSPLNRE